MLKNDTLKNGTSCIGLYGSAPPPPPPQGEQVWKGIARLLSQVNQKFTSRSLPDVC